MGVPLGAAAFRARDMALWQVAATLREAGVAQGAATSVQHCLAPFHWPCYLNLGTF